MQKSDYEISKLHGIGMIVLTTTALEHGISFDDNNVKPMSFLSGGIDFSYVCRR